MLTGFVAVVSAVEEEKLSGKMVLPGSWHGNEVVAKDGERWMALVEDQGGFDLREVVIAVEFVEDAVLDTPPGKTGRRVSVASGVEPLALLRSLPRLEPGPVKTAVVDDRNFNAGTPTGLYFEGIVFELELKCDEADYGKELADCPILLSGDGRQQELRSYPVFRPGMVDQSIASEALPQVFWAGDLDRDGRLDLILDLTDHYNVSAPTLLLSSPAKEGELVAPVAVFITTGC